MAVVMRRASRRSRIGRAQRCACAAFTAPRRHAALRRRRPPGATVSIDWCSIAGGVSPPMCGVAITRGWRASAGLGIWSGARPTSSAQPAMLAAVERVQQRRLVDQVAARRIDEERVALHRARMRRRPSGSRSRASRWPGRRRSRLRPAAAPAATCVHGRVGHARRADRPPARACRSACADVGQVARRSGRSRSMPSVAPRSSRPMRRRRRCAGAVLPHRALMPRLRSIITPTIHSDDRGHEAGAGLRDEDALRAGGGDVDVADVDRAAHEGHQLAAAARSSAALAFGAAVADDDVAVAARRRPARRASTARRSSCSAHVGHRLERGQRARAVVVGERARRCG